MRRRSGRLWSLSRILGSLTGDRWIGGENQFQALCLAIEFIRITLKAFADEGGRIYYHQTKEMVDLHSPSFVPLDGEPNGRRARPVASRPKRQSPRTSTSRKG